VPMASQSRLRAVLSKLSDQPERYDVRVVATSRDDLRSWIDKGKYRGDLYARLSGFEVRLPTLRERRDRLGVLLGGLCHAARTSASITTDAFRWALGYPWPYNVRQLVQAFTTAVTITGDDAIGRPALEAAVAGTGHGS